MYLPLLVRVHREMPTLVVFHPDWIVAIVKAHCLPKDHTCGPYYLCPTELRDTPAAAHAYNPNSPPTPPKQRAVNSNGGGCSPIKEDTCAGGHMVGGEAGAEVAPHKEALSFTSLESLVIQGKPNHVWCTACTCSFRNRLIAVRDTWYYSRWQNM